MMAVDRCVCNNVTFADFLRRAETSGCSDFEQLLVSAGVGDKCGMCRPYLECCLETGKTDVSVQRFEGVKNVET